MRSGGGGGYEGRRLRRRGRVWIVGGVGMLGEIEVGERMRLIDYNAKFEQQQ